MSEAMKLHTEIARMRHELGSKALVAIELESIAWTSIAREVREITRYFYRGPYVYDAPAGERPHFFVDGVKIIKGGNASEKPDEARG